MLALNRMAKSYESLSAIDSEKVTQLVFICVDWSGSMSDPYDNGHNRFTASQKFTQACDRYHAASL